MNSQQFSKFIKDPDFASDQNPGLLEDMVARFPYCQSGQLLLACNYYATDSAQYTNQLKKAAVYAGDRSILKVLVGLALKVRLQKVNARSEFRKPLSLIPTAPAEQVIQPEPESRSIENAAMAYERMTQEELLAIVKTRLAEIADSASHFLEPPSHLPERTSSVTKKSLIEKFIREEPRISKPKAVFFNPIESAIRSNFDEEEIVSETLAILYAQQGNKQKAIHVYEKLSLYNQEKSRFFAAQIEKLSS